LRTGSKDPGGGNPHALIFYRITNAYLDVVQKWNKSDLDFYRGGEQAV
jgi:hypothetical protein